MNYNQILSHVSYLLEKFPVGYDPCILTSLFQTNIHPSLSNIWSVMQESYMPRIFLRVFVQNEKSGGINSWKMIYHRHLRLSIMGRPSNPNIPLTYKLVLKEGSRFFLLHTEGILMESNWKLSVCWQWFRVNGSIFSFNLYWCYEWGKIGWE